MVEQTGLGVLCACVPLRSRSAPGAALLLLIALATGCGTVATQPGTAAADVSSTEDGGRLGPLDGAAGAEVHGDAAAIDVPTGADGATGPGDSTASGDTTAAPDGDPVADPWDLPGIPYKLAPGAPIAAPAETWTFVPVPDARCANGTSTGMAVNLSNKSKRVVFYLQGGGTCWEAAACAGGAATHITDTMGEQAVLAEAQAAPLQVLFSRTDPANPFRDASFVYVPYCTGDLHAGTKAHTYDWFGPKVVHHVGARNLDAYLARVAPTFPGADRLWLIGASAGGYGATFHWWRVQKALPWARVDVVNDSGLAIDTAADGRYGTMQTTWKIEFPPGCPDCAQHLGSVLTYQATVLAAPRRYGLMAYLHDQTIGLYFSLSGPQIQKALEALRASAPKHVRTFHLPGTPHVVLATPGVKTSDGTSAQAWLQALAGDGPWDHAGP